MSPEETPDPIKDQDTAVQSQEEGQDLPQAIREFDYDKLLEMYDLDHEKFEEGELVEGRVIALNEREAIIDIGYKSEGIIPIQEFLNEKGELGLSEGDVVEVLLEQAEDIDGNVILSKVKAERMKVWEKIEGAFENDKIIDGRVTKRIKGGLTVDIGIEAFLPGSLVDIRRIDDLESMVGKIIRCKVIKVNRHRNNIVISRKKVLEEERKEQKKETLKTLEVGKLMSGTVKNITDYGAFIDLGGIDGLLHITDMSWGRVSHPSEMFEIGQEVEVVILQYDLESERISLGYKQRTSDPWEDADEKYAPGSVVEGTVVSLTDYGAFVELEKGVEGLVHISEMSWTRRIRHPSEIVEVGETIQTSVLSIDTERRRISLGLKQTQSNPWDQLSEQYAIGDVITGVVRNMTEFGAFVEVREGIDGLIHISDLSWTRHIDHPSECLERDQEVAVVQE